MVVISRSVLNDFSEKCPDSESAIIKWYQETKAANWKNFSEVKKTFHTADYVGSDRYVFDIKGNQYRLVALIIFRTRTLFILFIGTHKDYDQIDASKINYKK